MAAGSAAMYGNSSIGSADDLPCADFGLLSPAKRSPEYASIRSRVADPKPVDAWQLDGVHYFVFELRPAADDPSAAASFALFKMRWEDYGPLGAFILTPNAHGTQAEVVDLRLGNVRIVSLAAETEETAVSEAPPQVG